MTGPEHYQEAERLIGIAREAAAPHAGGNKHLYFGARPETAWILAEAQSMPPSLWPQRPSQASGRYLNHSSPSFLRMSSKS
jgi:hypothetical protein